MNDKLLKSFTSYCKKHPEERFWQALRNWSGADVISYSKLSEKQNELWFHLDTFYWKYKNK